MLGGACIIYLLIPALVTSCERPPRPGPDKALLEDGVKITMVGPAQGHPQWPGIRGGAERYMAGVPTVKVEFLTPAEDTAASLRETLSPVLEQEPQAVCLYVTKGYVGERGKLREYLKLVALEQILLVTMGEPFKDTRIYGHVGVDLPGAAELLGDNVQRIAAGRRTYLLLHEDGAEPVATNCYHRFISAARLHHDQDWHLLWEKNAAEGDRPSAELVAEMLELFPHAGLVVTLSPEVWLTAEHGWGGKLRKLNRGYCFTTLSASPPLWHWLGTPEVPGDAAALVGPLDGEIGFAAVQMVVRALLSERQASPTRRIDCELVTPSNLPDFARRYSESANGLNVEEYLSGMLDVSTQ
ncbi:MAG: hypothetical protein KAY37_14205 [Phycisphaerae bacterium]|nr:hypothetical protein [Phycisphaerae bacterium]